MWTTEENGLFCRENYETRGIHFGQLFVVIGTRPFAEVPAAQSLMIVL